MNGRKEQMDQITNVSDNEWIRWGLNQWVRTLASGKENRLKIKRLNNEWKKRTNGSDNRWIR